MEQRETLRRIDDEDRKHKIATTRDIIYKNNYAVNTESVELMLKEQSLVPTLVSAISIRSPKKSSYDNSMQNAFSTRLGLRGFNLFSMFVVDLLHEFELGIWRALLLHLLRILNAANKSLVDELDKRCVNCLNTSTKHY